jgi:TonB family protein
MERDRKRVAAVLGPELSQGLLPLSIKRPGFELRMFLSAPNHLASARRFQHWFVNRRPIEARLLQQALYVYGLRVALHPVGRLSSLQVERPCGVGFLDDEAVAALQAAGPFPNPPHALVDERSGLIEFGFGFYFEVSNRPSFKVFRYSD